jgi:hypothetical protein
MGLRTIILWIHALCGVAWVGACASFVIAAAALSGEAGELSHFAVNTAPRINRIGATLALVIPLTGIGNLIYAARMRGFALPAQFVGVLSVKIALFAAMALTLAAAWRAEASMRSAGGADPAGAAADIKKLMRLYGLIMAMGGVALGLGLWLSGT